MSGKVLYFQTPGKGSGKGSEKVPTFQFLERGLERSKSGKVPSSSELQ